MEGQELYVFLFQRRPKTSYRLFYNVFVEMISIAAYYHSFTG